jgi:hypothetical protein
MTPTSETTAQPKLYMNARDEAITEIIKGTDEEMKAQPVSDEARKCAEDIHFANNDTKFVSEFEIDCIQRHLDAYHEAKSNELVRDKERLLERKYNEQQTLIEQQVKQLKLNAEDWADDDTRVKAAAKPFFTDLEINGDSHGVPGVVDIAELMAKRIQQQAKELSHIDERLARRPALAEFDTRCAKIEHAINTAKKVDEQRATIETLNRENKQQAKEIELLKVGSKELREALECYKAANQDFDKECRAFAATLRRMVETSKLCFAKWKGDSIPTAFAELAELIDSIEANTTVFTAACASNH